MSAFVETVMSDQPSPPRADRVVTGTVKTVDKGVKRKEKEVLHGTIDPPSKKLKSITCTPKISNDGLSVLEDSDEALRRMSQLICEADRKMEAMPLKAIGQLAMIEMARVRTCPLPLFLLGDYMARWANNFLFCSKVGL